MLALPNPPEHLSLYSLIVEPGTPYADAAARGILAMPDDAFVFAFGTEWFIRAGQGPGITETDLMS